MSDNHPMRCPALLLLPIALLAASCSSSSSSSATTAVNTAPAAVTDAPTTAAEPTTTTISAADAAKAYEDAGPNPVGVMTLQLAKGPKVEIWYPAAAGTTGTETYDMRDYIPAAVRALLPANVPSTHSYPAGRDAKVADGRFPVVLFSHGFASTRVQSTFLTAHLASWGMIVVAPEHPSRDLVSLLGGTRNGDRNDALDDLLKSLDLIIAADGDSTSPFNGHVDATHVAAVGHSAGGGTVLSAAADTRVQGYVSMSSGMLAGRAGAGSTTTSSAPATPPNKPSFFLGGSLDSEVPFDTVTKPAFDTVPSPSLLWKIDGAGHNAFTDFCTFGNGTGIIGVAEAAGLGALVDGVPGLRNLGEDGCIPPAVAVDTTFPIINHAVTAWLRNLFGIDPTPVGLGADVGTLYATKVTVTSK